MRKNKYQTLIFLILMAAATCGNSFVAKAQDAPEGLELPAGKGAFSLYLRDLKPVWESPELTKYGENQETIFPYAMEILGYLQNPSGARLPEWWQKHVATENKNVAASPELKTAPEWLQKMAHNFSAMPAALSDLSPDFADLLSEMLDWSPRLTSYKYRNQTVYYLEDKDLKVLYNSDGKVVCHENLEIEGGMPDVECPNFETVRSDGKLLWKIQQKTIK